MVPKEIPGGVYIYRGWGSELGKMQDYLCGLESGGEARSPKASAGGAGTVGSSGAGYGVILGFSQTIV
jgi:hypothetical protein